MTTESEINSSQKIINYTMDSSGKKAGDHQELDRYLLEDYGVVDIITNVVTNSNGLGYLSITVLLAKKVTIKAYIETQK